MHPPTRHAHYRVPSGLNIFNHPDPARWAGLGYYRAFGALEFGHSAARLWHLKSA